MQVDIPSHLLKSFLDYSSEGTLGHPIDEDLMTLASKVRHFQIIFSPNKEISEECELTDDSLQWSSGMLRSIAYTLVSSEINLKNVFEWTKRTRDVFPEVHKYCVWLMRVNYNAIKDKKEFLALQEYNMVSASAWPGSQYETRYKNWKEMRGKKKGKS